MFYLKDIDVLILCGGKGRRLKKITGSIPKPMVRIGRHPFLNIIIGRLKKTGFKRFILGVGFQANFIKKYYKEHKIPGVEIIFSEENYPLGTGGAVKKAKKFIKSRIFLVLNGDSFSEFNPEDFIRFYKQKKAEFLILLREAKNKHDYGEIMIDRKSKITCFNEKASNARGNFINGGVYLFNKSVFSIMPKKQKFSLEYDFFSRLIGKGLFGYKDSGFFIDIGTPERYLAAKRHFLKDYIYGKKR